jgi:hypothetical protein
LVHQLGLSTQHFYNLRIASGTRHVEREHPVNIGNVHVGVELPHELLAVFL